MNAEVCYVYLSDVPSSCPPLDGDFIHPSYLPHADIFDESRWFERGWTLQELIAPRKVLFFGSQWNELGSLTGLIDRVSGITNIPRDVLDHSRPLQDVSIARRLSWAANRVTTRKEDEAYCLFGILDVNMPLLYGEGTKAFLRLQEELVRHSTDQSLFAWDVPAGPVVSRELLFAPSPRCFKNCGRIRRRRGTASESAFHISNKGLEITLPVMFRRLESGGDVFALGLLDCRYEGSRDVLALVMKQHPFNLRSGTPAIELYVSGYRCRFESDGRDIERHSRLAAVDPNMQPETTPKLLTITRDLQSQSYVQAFSNYAPSWFPIRFTGSEMSDIPTLHGAWPEDCWSESSRTLRLPQDRYTYGGVLVSYQNNQFILIPLVYSATSGVQQGVAGSIGILALCDPLCSIEDHLSSLMEHHDRRRRTTISTIRLNEHQNLLAQLRDGALVVSVDQSTSRRSSSPQQAETSSSPDSRQGSHMRRASDSPTSPRPSSIRYPSSPTMQKRKDSFMSSDTRPRSSSGPLQSTELHRTGRCPRCQHVWAREREQRAQQEAERAKTEKNQKLMTRARQAGIGLSIGSVIGDLSGLAEFLG
jgi:hypothetical protein